MATYDITDIQDTLVNAIANPSFESIDNGFQSETSGGRVLAADEGIVAHSGSYVYKGTGSYTYKIIGASYQGEICKFDYWVYTKVLQPFFNSNTNPGFSTHLGWKVDGVSYDPYTIITLTPNVWHHVESWIQAGAGPEWLVNINAENTSSVLYIDDAYVYVNAGIEKRTDQTEGGMVRPSTVLSGTIYDGWRAPEGILPPTHTLFHVTRYRSTFDGSHARILTGNTGEGDPNWLSGHWANRVGVCYQDGWVYHKEAQDSGNNLWILSTTQQGLYRLNGVQMGTSEYTGTTRLNVNTGSENSEWEIAEMIIYDRRLTADEMVQVEAYLRARYFETGVIPNLPVLSGLRAWYDGESYSEIDRVWKNKAARRFSGGKIIGEPKKISISGNGIIDGWLDADWTPTVTTRSLPGTSGIVQVEDRIYERTEGTRVTDFTWTYSSRHPVPVTRSSSNEGVVIPDPADPFVWRHVSDGTATLTLSSAARTLTATVTASTLPSGATDVFLRFADGSLRKSIHDSIKLAIAGKDADDMTIWSTRDNDNKVYARNTDCWARELNSLGRLRCTLRNGNWGDDRGNGTVIKEDGWVKLTAIDLGPYAYGYTSDYGYVPYFRSGKYYRIRGTVHRPMGSQTPYFRVTRTYYRYQPYEGAMVPVAEGETKQFDVVVEYDKFVDNGTFIMFSMSSDGVAGDFGSAATAIGDQFWWKDIEIYDNVVKDGVFCRPLRQNVASDSAGTITPVGDYQGRSDCHRIQNVGLSDLFITYYPDPFDIRNGDEYEIYYEAHVAPGSVGITLTNFWSNVNSPYGDLGAPVDASIVGTWQTVRAVVRFIDGMYLNWAIDWARFPPGGSVDVHVRNVQIHKRPALSSIPVWNSVSGPNWGGIPITRRHILVAAHAPVQVGSKMYFTDEMDRVVERTVLEVTNATGYVPYHPDYSVCLLDELLPPGIKPVKFLPMDLANKLPSLTQNPVPILTTNQFKQLGLVDTTEVNGLTIRTRVPIDLDLKKFYYPKIGGDSGAQGLMAVGSDLGLSTVWTWGNSGSGTNLSRYVTDICEIASRQMGADAPSHDFASWGYGAATNNGLVAGPNGNVDATELTLSDGSVNWDVHKPIGSLTNGSKYTFSVWVKLGTATNFVISINDQHSWDNSVAAEYTVAGHGLSSTTWKRVQLTCAATGTGGVNIHLGGQDRPATPAQTAGTVFLWGWQFGPAEAFVDMPEVLNLSSFVTY